MLDQDGGADGDQREAAQHLCHRAEPLGRLATDQHADRRDRGRHQPDHDAGRDDADIQHREADADRHRVDAGRDRGEHQPQRARRPARRRLRLDGQLCAVRSPPRLPQHVTADDHQQGKGDPVADRLDPACRGLADQPADRRADRLGQPEHRADPEGLDEIAPHAVRALAQRGGEGIDRQAQAQPAQGENTDHDRMFPGPRDRPRRIPSRPRRRLASLVLPGGPVVRCLRHGRPKPAEHVDEGPAAMRVATPQELRDS